MIGKGATNIIPSKVEIAGTFRTFNETWRDKAHAFIKSEAESIAKANKGECQVNIIRGYPFMNNDPEVTRIARAASAEYLGTDQLINMDIRMTADDFAYYSQKYPSTYYRLGIKKPGATHPTNLHSPQFEADEAAIQTGMGVMSWIALQLLNN